MEEVFVRQGRVWSLHLSNQVIQTSAEHPFWTIARGWVQANE
ncbi:MAG: hypothetical protein ACRCZF_20700 [Gemmataceae bacterium]